MIACRPRFELRRVNSADSGEAPGDFAVLYRPWEFQVSRRRFLGLCLGLSGALLLDWLSLARAQWSATTVAGSRVDPEALSMIGIAATEGGNIDLGYHLRWFCDLPFPAEVFPDRDIL